MNGVIIIKKISAILILLLMFLGVSCESQRSISKSKDISVLVTTDVDTYDAYDSSASGITLTPNLEGKVNEDIQYHWTIDSDKEMFDSEEGPKSEITNSGESVVFIPVSEVSYVETDTISNTISISLEVEEKNSNNVLTKTELIIENYSGTYKVKKN